MTDLTLIPRLLRQWESPPVWLFLFLVAAWAQSVFLSLLPPPGWLALIGKGAFIAGAALLVASAVAFRTHRTTILPRETPSAMLETGPYAWSRNPIYLADAVMLAGAILNWDLASLILVPVFMAVIARRFIAGEEAGMEATFGDRFRAYASRVRRWL